MSKNNTHVQYNECLICLEQINKTISIINLLKVYPICISCLEQFEVIDLHTHFYQYQLHILYYYNDFFKKLLYQYKGQYDIALKDTFLLLYQTQLKKRYHRHIIVVAPSLDEDNQRRGFLHMEEIAKTITQDVFIGLYKKESYKQTKKKLRNKEETYQQIGIRDKGRLKGRKVLLLDDVLTSGSTLYACLQHIESCQPQSIECLVLSTHLKITSDMSWE